MRREYQLSANPLSTVVRSPSRGSKKTTTIEQGEREGGGDGRREGKGKGSKKNT